MTTAPGHGDAEATCKTCGGTGWHWSAAERSTCDRCEGTGKEPAQATGRGEGGDSEPMQRLDMLMCNCWRAISEIQSKPMDTMTREMVTALEAQWREVDAFVKAGRIAESRASQPAASGPLDLIPEIDETWWTELADECGLSAGAVESREELIRLVRMTVGQAASGGGEGAAMLSELRRLWQSGPVLHCRGETGYEIDTQEWWDRFTAWLDKKEAALSKPTKEGEGAEVEVERWLKDVDDAACALLIRLNQEMYTDEVIPQASALRAAIGAALSRGKGGAP